MDYLFEMLGEDRFQQLCQSIVVASEPLAQCLAIGQPDGGRDALIRRPADSSPEVVYQVKYARNPSTREARDSIETIIELEKDKVSKLKERGLQRYYLMTNVGGTAHLDAGSVDKVNLLLTETFGVPCFCYWREDLARRLDANASIRWAFLELLKPGDILEQLIGRTDLETQRRTDAVKRYIAIQAKHDENLKFKQVRLDNSIHRLFVDLPARLHPRAADDDAKVTLVSAVERAGTTLFTPPSADENEGTQGFECVGLSQLLLNASVSELLGASVIEGAPGQGKSTITQYLCQAHRAVLLSDKEQLALIPETLRPSGPRIPFRVDLRDYASWLQQFAGNGPAVITPSTDEPLLEAFLAYQVRRATGSAYSVDDLIATLKQSQVLFALDGFDEVADVSIRSQIVHQVEDAIARLQHVAISLQVIVTSRPAAFANSPGFSRERWTYLELRPLHKVIVRQYAERWVAARSLNERESNEVLETLEDKLREEHVRDLSRNPMQLAILLDLILVHGGSLPDKRTALYDRYIETFFSRESEKSRIVREHRDVLLKIHGYIAWKLHVQAEQAGAGHMEATDLQRVLVTYLESEGHPAQWAAELFSGMVERVVALISRIEGTYEFEVQPVREYFAARYLYNNAPYAPAGAEVPGTLPERFDAMAQNPFWLNVCRFFAGCYNAGELDSLVGSIIELNSRAANALSAAPSELGFYLLRDYVFNQRPLVARHLVEQLVNDPSFIVFLAQVGTRSTYEDLMIPQSSGREIVISRLAELAGQDMPGDAGVIAARALGQFAPREQRLVAWEAAKESLPVKDWWLLAADLRLFDRMELGEFEALKAPLIPELLRRIANFERPELFRHYAMGPDEIAEWMLDAPLFSYPFISKRDPDEYQFLEALSFVTSPLFYVSAVGDDDSVNNGWSIWNRFAQRDELGPSFVHKTQTERSKRIASALVELLDQPSRRVRADMGVTSMAIESLLTEFGVKPALYRWALFAFNLARPSAESLDPLPERSLCSLVAKAAENTENELWWNEWFSHLSHPRAGFSNDPLLFLMCLSCFGQGRLIYHFMAPASALLSHFDQDRWQAASDAFEYGWLRRRQEKLSHPPANLEEISPRAAALFISSFETAAKFEVWRKAISGNEGSDQVLNAVSVEVAIASATAGLMPWREAFKVIVECQKACKDVYLTVDLDEAVFQPDEARLVCGSPTQFPAALVDLASRTLRDDLGGRASKVYEIADRDGWFAHGAQPGMTLRI